MVEATPYEINTCIMNKWNSKMQKNRNYYKSFIEIIVNENNSISRIFDVLFSVTTLMCF